MSLTWRLVLLAALIGGLIGFLTADFLVKRPLSKGINNSGSQSTKTDSSGNVPVHPALELPIFNVETDQEEEDIITALLEMPPEVSRSMPFILVRKDIDHFQNKQTAHTHNDGRICFLSQFLSDATKEKVWHEGARSRLLKLGDEFLEKCIEVSGGLEAYVRYSDNQKFPHNGFLWERSMVNCRENLALLAEAIYRYAVLDDVMLTAALKKADAKTKKINLANTRMLLEAKIISAEVFKKIEPLFR